MKVLVYGELGVGGSGLNSIELAAALRDLHGFEVVIFGTPGPLVQLVREKGLRLIAAPYARRFPSPIRIRALREAIEQERPDVLHVWDWFQTLDAYYGVFLPMRIPLLITDMTMGVSRILPKRLLTTFGTPQLVDQARRKGRHCVELLLPPVDIHLNAPGCVDGRPLRQQYNIKDADIAIVTVSRLDNYLKRESLYRTLEVIRELGHDLPVTFIVVGDGEERARLAQRAEMINSDLKRQAVVFTGFLVDPRAAYAAADVVVGMGGSSLRGMAFGKSVVIVGDSGFSSQFTPETAPMFYYTGMYGRGDGNSSNAQLYSDIRTFAENPALRAAVGKSSREFVMREFTLEKQTERLADYCRRAASTELRFRERMADGLRTAAVYLRERRFLTIGSQDPRFMLVNVPSETTQSFPRNQ